MERWQGRVAVVTGASSGIGAAIAKDLVEAGLTVVGLARRKERIDEMRINLPKNLQNQLHAVHCDVSDLRSVNEAFDWIIQNLGGVDILINSAGTRESGQLLTQNIAAMQQMFQTNVMGVLHCTQRAYDSMKQRNFDGHIVNVNSISGHKVHVAPAGKLPEYSVYPATKHALTAINEVLPQELHALGTKIKVTSISPGAVDTEFIPEQYRKVIPTLSAKDISSAVLYAISTPPGVQVLEITIKSMG